MPKRYLRNSINVFTELSKYFDKKTSDSALQKLLNQIGKSLNLRDLKDKSTLNESGDLSPNNYFIPNYRNNISSDTAQFLNYNDENEQAEDKRLQALVQNYIKNNLKLTPPVLDVEFVKCESGGYKLKAKSDVSLEIEGDTINYSTGQDITECGLTEKMFNNT